MVEGSQNEAVGAIFLLKGIGMFALYGGVGLITVLSSPSRIHADETIYGFPENRSVYFRYDYITGSQYLEFRPDGTYRKIWREHMFVREDDHGTWSQAANGDVTLSSEVWPVIWDGPLAIHTSKESLSLLPHARELLISFLETHNQPFFSAQEVKQILQQGNGQADSLVPNLPVIEVKWEMEISQEQLRGLLRALDTYLEREHQYVFHCTRQSPVSLVCGLTGYESIDQNTFEEETGTTQPFIFFPELNQQ